MGSRNSWSTTVYNDTLGVSKVINGSTQEEVQYKAAEQERKWAEQAARLRGKEGAVSGTEAAQKAIAEFKSILLTGLKKDCRIKWKSLEDHQAFSVPPPALETIQVEFAVPTENRFIEMLFPSRKKARLQKEEEARALSAKMEEDARALHAKRMSAHKEAEKKYLAQQSERNEEVNKFRTAFEALEPQAVEKYAQMVLEHSRYPKDFTKEYQLQYDAASEILIVSFELPPKEDVPRIVEYRYVATRGVTNVIEMKPKEFDEYYEDVLYQICLRTIHEVFKSVYVPGIKSVVFNGWVKGVDTKTGQDFHSCIMSCQASREEFETYNLERVRPKECFNSLKGICAGPLAQLAPVRPIMNLNSQDPRFIESREVLEGLQSQNLATMDWADFEHLVRELFEKEFTNQGGEVKVTQASRDGGVDAIAFDPDPIRGGKFVIQAKRYNGVVPVSSVRDLYGTMISEGASKGILVTTSYYGNDSREFAKDKPVTLLDGSNLVYMFKKHGYDVAIELQPRA